MIDGSAHDEAPREAYEDVTGIVDTEVEARPAVDKRIDDKRHGEQPATDEPAEIDSDAERVGCVGREKAVLAPAIAIDDIDKHANLRVVGWSPTAHKGFDDGIIDGAGEQDAEGCSPHDEENLLDVLIVLEDDIEEAQVERHPGPCIGQGSHEHIIVQRLAAVEEQQELLVELYEF